MTDDESILEKPSRPAHGTDAGAVRLALVLVVSGWKMTGQLAGLGIMLVGVALLLAVLALYNAAYD